MQEPEGPDGPVVPPAEPPAYPPNQPPAEPPAYPPNQPPAYPPAYPPAPPCPAPGAVPWRGTDVALVLGVGVGLVILSFVAVFLAFAATGTELSVGTFVIAQVVAYASQAWIGWYVIFRRRRATAEQVGFKWVGAGPLLLMFPGLIGLLIINVVVGMFSFLLFGDVTTAQEQLVGEGDSLLLSDFIPLFFVVVVVAPIVEEFIFRGVFFQQLRSRRSFWFAASISALVFSLSHFIPSLIPSFFALGMVLAGVVERYKSIYPAIALHAINNAFAMVVVYVSLN